MKHRILAFFLVLAMLMGMIVLPGYAAEEETVFAEGYCQHCKRIVPENEWLAWDVTDTAPRGGHYYLDRDITGQTGQIIIGLDDDLLRNVVCLDLRGRTYTVTGLRPFLNNGVLSVMDSVGGGEIATTGASNAHGGFVMMGKHANSKDGSAVLNLYSGTIRRINTKTDLVSYGGLIHAASGATVNVYGGTLVGGEVVPHLISKTNYAPLGGTIYANGAYVNLYGGTITGGVSRSGTLYKVGSTTETQKFEGTGGNIYAVGGAVNIAGGVLENGYADVYAGNLYAKGTNVTISGGTIRNGATDGASGSIQFGGAAKLTISGGHITGGVCRTRGGNLFVNDSNVSIEITGGTIDGDLSVGLFKAFTLSGTPRILLGNSNGLCLEEGTGKLSVEGLQPGAEIYLDAHRKDTVVTTVLEAPETYLAYFKEAIRADISVDDSGALKVEQGTTGFCPHCWQSGTQATWTAFDNSAPGTNLTIDGAHHVYLTGTTNRTRLLSISAGADYVLDSAGYTYTVTGYKFANLYGKLSLLDSRGWGKITGTGHPGANGGVIMGSSTGEFHLYSGTLSRTVKSGEASKRVFAGGVLYAPGSSKTYIHGGIIKGGIASIAYKGSSPYGGNVSAAGTFEMTGGVFLDGQAYSCMGTVSGSSDAPTSTDKLYVGCGGNLYVSGTANITGGHFIGGSAGYGGNVFCKGSVKISGCVIRDGVVDQELNANDWGGNLYYTGTADSVIENALIRGGTAANLGGNINLYNSVLTIRDSLIAEGNATGSDGRGGNLYANADSTLDLYDSTVSAGTAYNVGGNLHNVAGAKVTMHSGLIQGGVSQIGDGGSIYSGEFTMTGGRITGGTTQAGVGGNIAIYGKGTGSLIIAEDGNASTPAPVISNGSSAKLGGNISLAVGTTGDISDAHIYGGTGDTKKTNATFDADNVFGNEQSVLTVTDCTVSGIVAENQYGNGIYSGGELILKGNTQVTNDEINSCMYISSVGKLTVDASFTGYASVALMNNHFTAVEAPHGTALAEQDTATGAFTGTLLLEGYLGRDYGLPALFTPEGDTRLYVASTAVVDPAAGTTRWFKDAQSAVDAASQGSYIRLQGAENTVTVSGDLAVDLNGKNLTVTGSGKLMGFDTANDDYDGYGILTASGITVEPAYAAPNGRQYVTVTDDSGISFHRLGQEITNVVLRPAQAGIYYRSQWQCDAVLSGKLIQRGIALSVDHMPKNDFHTDPYVLYTKLAGNELDTSVLVRNILLPEADNQSRGTRPIYAAPYAIIDNGTEAGLVIVSEDGAPTQGGVEHTLQQVLQKVDLIWPALTEKQQIGIRSMYAIAPEILETWSLYNITGAVTGKPAVRPLKILTIGHSLAVDSGHMINLVADAEGYDQEFIIGTLYYSGCPLYKHVNYLQHDSAVYRLYLSSTKTPNQPPVIYSGMTMKMGITFEDWDIIIMQGGVFEIAEDVTYTDGNIQIIRDYVNQHKTNPDALFAWHMPWAPPTDNDLRDLYPYSPNTYYTSYEKYGDDRTVMYHSITGAVERNIVTDPEFVYLIPTGTAIENALSSYLEESDLHRDYVHVTDLGRVIASYTWYCVLMGVDHLDEVKLDAIPKAFFQSTTGNEDRVLTDAEKAIILESVNNALKDPLHMTQSQYTQAPTQ